MDCLKSDHVKALLGTIDQSFIIEFVKNVAASDGDGAYLALNKITELNVEYEQVLKIIISVFIKSLCINSFKIAKITASNN